MCFLFHYVYNLYPYEPDKSYFILSLHHGMTYISLRRPFLCLANKLPESEFGAAVGDTSEGVVVADPDPNQGKHLCILTYYFYTLDKLIICYVSYCICRAIG